jgi:putative oxidoreductase
MPAALRTRLDDAVQPIAYLLLRLVAGGFLVAHGWPKWQAGVGAFAEGLVRRGLEPALPLAWMVVSLEMVGGALIAAGLLTRPAAFAAALHLAFITFWVLWPAGFAWARGGWEFAAMWATVMLYIATKGGGPWSLDRLLFRR